MSRHVPDGYVTREMVQKMAEPLLADGWTVNTSSFSVASLTKGDLKLDFRYKYNPHSFSYRRDEESIFEASQVRMFYRDPNNYMDVAKWTSYPKFTKAWVDKVFAELTQQRNVALDRYVEAVDRNEFLKTVEAKASDLAKELDMSVCNIKGSQFSPAGQPLFDLVLAGCDEAEVRELVKLFKSRRR